MRKLTAPVVVFGLAVVLMGAEAATAIPQNGAGPHVFTDSGITLQLTSSMPGVTFSGNSLVCPPFQITTSSGENLAACEFTISSVGTVAPSSIAVTMEVAGISPAQAAAHKFAIAPQPGPLAYFRTTPQTLYTFTGADLPVTVHPGVVWGANAGAALDNGDLNTAIVVTYAVVAQSLEGATATPTASGSQIVEGATAVPRSSSTPPPTAVAAESPSGTSTPLLALLICFLLSGLLVVVTQIQRRNVRR